MQKYFTCKEVADIFNLKIDTIWNWVRTKKINALVVGKEYRISSEELKRFESEHMTFKEG